MKILQVNKFFWPKGGSETYYFLLSGLLQDIGHEVIPFSMHHPNNLPSAYSKFFVPHIDFQDPHHRLKKSVQFLYSTTARRQLEKLISEVSPDVAHVHNIAHQLTPAILPILKKHGIPVVQTLHDYQLICPNYKLYTQGSPCERCFQHKYYQATLHKCVDNSASKGFLAGMELALHRMLLKSYQQVDVFICPSQFLFNKLITWGIPQDKLKYLPNCVEQQPVNVAWKKRNYMVYAGRLTQEKGIEVLLQAVKLMPERQFVIAGRADEKNYQEKIQWVMKSLPNVKYVGQVTTHTNMQKLLAEAQALIVPSVWYENSPLNVLEALSLGTWVVSTRQGGLPELIQEGKNGVFWEASKPETLVESLKKLTDLPPKPSLGLEQKFSTTYHIQQIMQWYQDLNTSLKS